MSVTNNLSLRTEGTRGKTVPGRAIKTALRTRLGSNGCGPEPHGEPGYSSYFESSFTAETCSDPPEHNYVLPNTKTDVQHAREHVWWTCFDGHAAGRRRRQATTDCAHAAAGCEAPQRRITPLHCGAAPLARNPHAQCRLLSSRQRMQAPRRGPACSNLEGGAPLPAGGQRRPTPAGCTRMSQAHAAAHTHRRI